MKKKFQIKNPDIVIRLIVAAFIPATVAFFYLAVRGISVFDLYIPSSYNNDSLFYYKMVDGVVNGGGIRGYFGYNESHAIYGGFGAWNPILLFPWIIWGYIFGWGYTSAVICNLVLVSLSFILFAYFSDVSLKNLFVLFAFLLVFPAFSINVLNALPEAVLLPFAVIYSGLAAGYAKKQKSGYLISMVIMCMVLTVVRPYYLLLFFLPMYYLIRNSKRKVWIIILGLSAVLLSVFGYFLISRYFQSLLASDLFNMNILHFIFEWNLYDAFGYSVYILKLVIPQIIEMINGAFSYGLTIGTVYFISLLCMIFAVVCAPGKSVDHVTRSIRIFVPVCYLITSYVFIMMLQRPNEGGRHLWIYSVVSLLIVCLLDFDFRGIIGKSVIFIFLLIFTINGSYYPTDYDVPAKTKEAEYSVILWEYMFDDDRMELSDEMGYDNTLIWVLGDYVDGNLVITRYDEMYSLPAGMGINCCRPEYLTENFYNLHSRYILTVPGGVISNLCELQGYEIIGNDGHTVVYKRY